MSYCDFVAATALALALQSRGDDGYGVAALMLAATLPLAVLAPLAGRLVDRADSRTVLVATGVGQAIVCTILAYTTNVTVTIALVAVLTAGLALTQPALSALIPAMVGRDQLAKAMSIGQTAGAIGMLAGPALGGLLIGSFGLRPPLLLDAATYLALAVAGFAIQTRRGGRRSSLAGAAAPRHAHADHGHQDKNRGDEGEDRRFEARPWRLRDDSVLVGLVGAMAAVLAVLTAANVVEIFFVRDTLGGSAATYVLVAGAWTMGLLFGALPFGRIKGDDVRLAVMAVLLLLGRSAAILASSAVPAAFWLLPTYLFGGSLKAGLNVIAGVLVGRRVSPAFRGRAAGLFAGAANTGAMAGYVAGGVLTPIMEARTLIAGTGVAGVAVAAAFLIPVVVRIAGQRVPARSAGAVGYRQQA